MYAKQLETKDLILGKIQLEDAEALWHNYWSRPEPTQYMLWQKVETLQEAIERTERGIEFQKDHLAFCVYTKEGHNPIGLAAMKEIEPNVWDDCGIGIGPDFVGRGYGKQILQALVDECFRLGATKIYCSCFVENIASKKMQLACGFEFSHQEEKIREHDQLKYTVDVHMLTREKYLMTKNI